jgi:hypothetical protein
MEISVTQCPAKSCDHCYKFYINDLINCEIICKCKCHQEHYVMKENCRWYDSSDPDTKCNEDWNGWY